MDTPENEPERALDKQEQAFLLDIARKTILEHVESGKRPSFASDNPNFTRISGAFVTLRKKSGPLRGCIGHVESLKPLLQTVADMALASSSCDPRFKPVIAEELAKLDLEISVLTPLKEIERIEQVVVGRDGLLIRKSSTSGLLLPQVAAEQGWGRDRFVEETCRKAGLPKTAWREPEARLFIFSAQVFGESLL
jgi:AmmeMemoRadiSam system protein A